MPRKWIDLEANDAALKLLAIMIWPADPEARDNFLVKAAACSMATVEARLHQHAAHVLERTLQTVLPTLAEAARLPHAEALAERTAAHTTALVAAIKAEIDRDNFRPHGGLAREVYAPGLQAILDEAEATADGKYGRACGEILGYIVMMCHHHPGLAPSIKLATHIMVSQAKHEGRYEGIIPGDRGRKEMWRVWGGVAPLWTARALAAHQLGLPRISVQLVLQYAHWLANSAIKFRHDKSEKWLLMETDIVRVNAELLPLEPPIPPLTDRQLSWARSY